MFLDHRTLCTILSTYKPWLSLAVWSSKHQPVFVRQNSHTGDFRTIAAAVHYATKYSYRVHHIVIGVGIFWLPDEMPLPPSTSIGTGTSPLPSPSPSSGLTLDNIHNLTITGTTIPQKDRDVDCDSSSMTSLGYSPEKMWQTTVLGQWDIKSSRNITLKDLRIQSSICGVRILYDSKVDIISCCICNCKKKGIVVRGGASGLIRNCRIVNNAGFAGLLCHGEATRCRIENIVSFKIHV